MKTGIKRPMDSLKFLSPNIMNLLQFICTVADIAPCSLAFPKALRIMYIKTIDVMANNVNMLIINVVFGLVLGFSIRSVMYWLKNFLR